MKLTAIFLTIFFLQASASGYGQKINLNGKNTDLEKVLLQIKKQSGYVFLYTDQELANTLVTVKVKDASIEEALNASFKNTRISYKIEGKNILLKITTSPIEAGLINVIKPPVNIKGRVADEKNNPLPGVNVKIKGTNTGTVTDAQGKYQLTVPDGNRILVFSLIGYQTRELPVNGSNTVDVVLKEQSSALGEVVVTALGLEKSSKSITYDVQKLDASDINTQKDGNFMADLSGKVAGATINASASGQGGAVRVVLRGTRSLTGNNNALYVVDGIPLQDLRSSQPSSTFGGTDNGEGISSLNPDDIASVSVLSGPSAAALYGFRGANGVILITTKKGRSGKTSVNYSSNVSFSSPFVLPEFQNTYGSVAPLPGAGPTFSSYGDKLSTPSSYKPSDFFKTGTSYTNSVNVTSGSDKTQNYFSVSSANSGGIITNNKYNRYNFTDRVTAVLIPNKLTLDVSAMYVIEERQNPIGQGQYNNPLVGVYLFPPGDVNSVNLKDYARFNATRNFDTQYWPYGDLGLVAQNPYWIVNKEFTNIQKNRFLGTVSLKYNVTPDLDLIGRVKYDYNNDQNIQKKYASTNEFLTGGANGSFGVSNSTTKTAYADLLVNYTKKLNQFSLNATLGGSFEDNRSNGVSAGGALSVIPDFFSLSNVDQQHLGAGYSPLAVQQNQAVFASAQLGYKNLLFLETTARNDWNSALAYSSKKSIFYPSVGLSGIVSDMVKLPDFISYAKLRVSYAEVGNAPASYLTNPLPSISNGTINTVGAAPFTILKPERTKSIEGGADLRFFKDAVNLSVTYYNSRTINQIFSVSVPPAVGFSSYYINAGQVNNQGIQATLGYTVKGDKFSWNPNLVFSLNRNKIAKLLSGFQDPYTGKIIDQDTLDVAGGSGYLQRVVRGQSANDIYALDLVKDANGNLVTVPSTGLPSISKYNTKVGSAAPNYTLGFNNRFTYANFNLGFLVSARVGGQVVSATQALMDQYGVSQASADARNNGGVEVNGKKVDAQSYYKAVAGTSGGSGAALALYTFSATNVRLGEVTFGYTIPGTVFNNKIQSISISLVGRNLWMIYNKAPFDPESTASTGTFYQGFDYLNQPSLRSLGFRINVSL
ncbi:SusC/RagA family TonB-linked outer membrane protein [Pedobacter nototheniae]|uniref:SusC/RagA family TonB-linked outer membrane protein n=1 Tax=Pedobacter nototheniae TaxID=2488994 RepID=UPI00292FCBD6|nr:SusC/RagA family TonB-linked outer membrane protein [Pedobacter nototheniae]